MASSNRDETHIFSEFEDPERKRLISNIAHQEPRLAEIRRPLLFMLWFSDIDVLRDMAAEAPNQTRWRNVFFRVFSRQFDAVKFAKTWAGDDADNEDTSLSTESSRIPRLSTTGATPRSSEKASSRSRSASPKQFRLPYRQRSHPDTGDATTSFKSGPGRSEELLDAAMARDKNACVVSKLGPRCLEVAHIVPAKLHGQNRFHDWNLLEVFWAQDRVKKWQRELRAGGEEERVNTKQLTNMITLSCLVHELWNQGDCAFRPIRVNEDGTSMDVAFHWLPAKDDSVKADILLPIVENPYGSGHQGFGDNGGDNMHIYNHTKRSLVSSGDIFTVTTDDPIGKPLPSFALLHLQWHLRRIAAMQGATEDDDSDMDSKEDFLYVDSDGNHVYMNSDGNVFTVPQGSPSAI